MLFVKDPVGISFPALKRQCREIAAVYTDGIVRVRYYSFAKSKTVYANNFLEMNVFS